MSIILGYTGRRDTEIRANAPAPHTDTTAVTLLDKYVQIHAQGFPAPRGTMYNSGETVTFNSAEAEALIAAGKATLV